MKKILVILSLLLLITGCGKGKKTTSDPNQKNATTSSNNSLGTSFYRMVNFGNAEYRKKFYDAITTTQDFEKIGRQLQLLSTKHYSTDKYYLAEGNILSKDNVYQLLRRSDDPNKYPNTIQPKKGTSIEGVNNPIMVSTIYEQDYYTKSGSNYDLYGISIAIVINPMDENGKQLETKMSQTTINEYAQKIIPITYKYLKTLKKLKDVNLNICVYQLSGSTESNNPVDGRYIYQGFGNDVLEGIESLNFSTLVFTSTEATNTDPDNASQFLEFKNKMKKASLEAIGLVGYGSYEKGDLKSLKIEMTVSIKTYSELIYLISLAADDLAARFNNIDVTVVVNSQDKLEGFITIIKGKATTTMI